MLAKLTTSFPKSGEFLYEPKWDGFRTLVFVGADGVRLQSRSKKPLGRYFPELLEPLGRMLPPGTVLDGEIVMLQGDRLDFETLQMRLHPAKSRVQLLSEQTPAAFVAFDLLAEADEDLQARPMAERRARLQALLSNAEPPLHLTPATTDKRVAEAWFERFEGAGLDGVIAKPLDLHYLPKQRAMLKIKHRHDVDCVVAGFRWHKNGPGTLVGSLLLGLYDAEGKLQHVGITSARMDVSTSRPLCTRKSTFCPSLSRSSGPGTPRLMVVAVARSPAMATRVSAMWRSMLSPRAVTRERRIDATAPEVAQPVTKRPRSKALPAPIEVLRNWRGSWCGC